MRDTWLPLLSWYVRMANLWHFQLFGGFAARYGDHTLGRLRTRAQSALLSYLALTPGTQHPRELLADLFWPDATMESGRASLRTALAGLRVQLEGPGLAPEGTVVLAHGNAAVSLAATALTSDVEQFRAALNRAASLSDETETVAALQEAVRLYTGPLLPGLADLRGVREERARLAEAYTGALIRLARLSLEAERFEEARLWGERAITADPLREEGYGALIQALRLLGREPEACRCFAELERLLADSVGTTPSAATRALMEGEPHLPARGVTGSRFAVAGNPAPSRETAIHLPVAASRFFGREQEIQEASELLADSQTRLVTLTGTGGSGKTRLAVDVARRAALGFPGAVAFVPLVDLRDPAALSDAIATALHLPRPPRVDVRDTVEAALKGEVALLILDNCEQLLPGVGDEVHALLTRLPLLRCLVTSRQCLAIEGEREMPVGPLPVPEESKNGELNEEEPLSDLFTSLPTPPSSLLEYAGVRLFVHRAQTTRPDFQATPRNAADVARLCARLEGIPLALELAASWAGMLTPAQMLERMEQTGAFGLLTAPGRRRDFAVRHTALRSAIQWGYDLLPPEARRLFAHLSIFRGGWTLEYAEAICEEVSLLEGLTLLREHSFVIAEESATEDSEAFGSMRYRMLETLREFAGEQLGSEDQAGIAERHAHYFAALVRREQPHLEGPDPVPHLERLERERANLAAALEWYAGRPEDLAGYLNIVAALGAFWIARGPYDEGRHLLETALERASDSISDRLRAEALGYAGELAALMSRGEIAERYFTETYELYQRAKEPGRAALALKDKAAALSERSQFDRAGELLEEALATLRAEKDQEGEALALIGKGRLLIELNRDSEARQTLEAALPLIAASGRSRQEAVVLHNLGIIACRVDDYEAACDYGERAVAILRRLNIRWHLARALDSLGAPFAHTGDFAAARHYFEEALEVRREIRDPDGMFATHYNLGALCVLQEDFDSAGKHLRAALTLARRIDIPRDVATLLSGCGCLAAAQQRFERAAHLWGASEALFAMLGVQNPHKSALPLESPYRETAIQALGEERLMDLWREGMKMPLAEAIAYADQA